MDDDLIIEGSPEDLEALRRLLEAELGADAAVQPVTSAQSGELREPIITALVVGLGGPVLTNAVASVIRRYLQHRERMAEIAIMNMDKIPHDRAAFGSTVHLTEDNGEKIIYQLVMPEEADADKGMISTSSPIGRAILNKEEGDEVKVVTPNGANKTFELIKLVTIHDEA